MALHGIRHNNVTLGDEARRGPPPTPPQRVVPEAAAVCLRLWVGVGGCFGRLFRLLSSSFSSSSTRLSFVWGGDGGDRGAGIHGLRAGRWWGTVAGRPRVDAGQAGWARALRQDPALANPRPRLVSARTHCCLAPSCPLALLPSSPPFPTLVHKPRHKLWHRFLPVVPTCIRIDRVARALQKSAAEQPLFRRGCCPGSGSAWLRSSAAASTLQRRRSHRLRRRCLRRCATCRKPHPTSMAIPHRILSAEPSREIPHVGPQPRPPPIPRALSAASC